MSAPSSYLADGGFVARNVQRSGQRDLGLSQGLAQLEEAIANLQIYTSITELENVQADRDFAVAKATVRE